MAEQPTTDTISRLPCPFCGCTDIEGPFEHKDGFRIECDKCYANLFMRPLHGSADECKARLRERWNTRSSPGAPAEPRCAKCGEVALYPHTCGFDPLENFAQWCLGASPEADGMVQHIIDNARGALAHAAEIRGRGEIGRRAGYRGGSELYAGSPTLAGSNPAAPTISSPEPSVELPALCALVSRKVFNSANYGCTTLTWEEMRRIDDALAELQRMRSSTLLAIEGKDVEVKVTNVRLPGEPCEKPVLYQARRKSRFTGDWDQWNELTIDPQEFIDSANENSVIDEWELRALYAKPISLTKDDSHA